MQGYFLSPPPFKFRQKQEVLSTNYLVLRDVPKAISSNIQIGYWINSTEVKGVAVMLVL